MVFISVWLKLVVNKYFVVCQCAHAWQIENLAETNFVKIFGRSKQILSVQCVRALSTIRIWAKSNFLTLAAKFKICLIFTDLSDFLLIFTKALLKINPRNLFVYIKSPPRSIDSQEENWVSTTTRCGAWLRVEIFRSYIVGLKMLEYIKRSFSQPWIFRYASQHFWEIFWSLLLFKRRPSFIRHRSYCSVASQAPIFA